MKRIHMSSRDSARTPMQWSSEKYAGFSTVRPWFYVNKNYRTVNVAAEENDPLSILNFYRKCLALRRENKGLIFGDYHEHYHLNPHLYVYERNLNEEHYLIVISFSKKTESFKMPSAFDNPATDLILSNYDKSCLTGMERKLNPYEARLYRLIRF